MVTNVLAEIVLFLALITLASLFSFESPLNPYMFSDVNNPVYVCLD